MESKEKESQGKKVYTKPTVTRVDLVAEEAVLGVCKTGNNGFPTCGGVCTGNTPSS